MLPSQNTQTLIEIKNIASVLMIFTFRAINGTIFSIHEGAKKIEKQNIYLTLNRGSKVECLKVYTNGVIETDTLFIWP